MSDSACKGLTLDADVHHCVMCGCWDTVHPEVCVVTPPELACVCHDFLRGKVPMEVGRESADG